MYHKFLQYDSLNYAAKSFDVDEGENIEIKYKWFMFVWDEVELEHKCNIEIKYRSIKKVISLRNISKVFSHFIIHLWCMFYPKCN